MNNKKKIISIITTLAISFIVSSISYDLFNHEISIKELNLSAAEHANKSSMSINGYLYDSGQRNYGAYQNACYDYEEHQRKYEKRHSDIDSLKNTRNSISILIVLAGGLISFLIYKDNYRSILQDILKSHTNK